MEKKILLTGKERIDASLQRIIKGDSVETFFGAATNSLIEACIYGEIETVKVLVSHGTSINTMITYVVEGKVITLTALKAAIIAENFEVVNQLLEMGADPNVTIDEKPLFQIALRKAPKETIELFIKKGVDVNSEHYGRTPLMMACLYGRDLEIIEFMIKKGANKEAKKIINYKGGIKEINALSIAKARRNWAVAEFLEKKIS